MIKVSSSAALGERQLRPLECPLLGAFSVPGDKSLSHRALMLAAMAEGESHLCHLLDSWDVRTTFTALSQLGMRSWGSWEELRVQGWGAERQAGPLELDCGNSGTTMRLLSGILAAGEGDYTLRGDDSLSRRPMKRIAEPLRSMGAHIETSPSGTAPLRIRSTGLRALEYSLPVPSAQIKSCLLLAGAQTAGITHLRGDRGSRDHSERMLRALGAQLSCDGSEISLRGPQRWPGFAMDIPGDPSSAAFPLALALLVPGSDITISKVGLNPTRLGFFRLLRDMGAELEWQVQGEELGEPWGYIRARSSALRGIEVSPEDVPGCIDELVLLAVVASYARGRTKVCGARELRHKECDRLQATAAELRRLGADITELEDGWIIQGPCRWQSGRVTTHGDHRLEMALAVAALGSSAERTTVLEETRWSGVSWPGFWEDLAIWMG